jgi:imidazolonepropionase
LVDCHTHLVHAGTRWREFELRSAGATRKEILDAGWGLLSTVRATRAASDEALFSQSAARARKLVSAGVTTVEIKSGYGLDLDTELRMLRVARQLGDVLPLNVKSTFLGAHAVAPEYAGRPDDYIEFLCAEVLPAAAAESLVDAVDGFCDASGFTHAQIAKLFAAAADLGIPVKLHADQYSAFGAPRLVAQFRGLSADHLECADEASIQAMAEAGVVATLLPGANWTLNAQERPPVDLLRSHGVKMALATNCNPGSSPTTSPTMMMNMTCQRFGMTPEEALAGFTRVGAQALGMADSHGTLESGKVADLAVWDVEHPAELSYFIADNRCSAVMKGGQLVYRQPEMVIGAMACV